MKNQTRTLICAGIACLLILLCNKDAYAQRSVGIGTDSPNPNAVLELVTTGDQGLLLPRMTTAQRNAPTLTSLLTDSDNGLTVFDTDDGKMYFWFNGEWVTSTVSLTSGAGINVTGNVITNTGDTDGSDDIVVSSEAAGDVSGTFSTTVVEGLQGNPVSATLPSTGQVLKWNGSAWEPATDDGQVLTAGAGVDLAGNVITNTGDLDPSDDVLRSDVPEVADISGSYEAGFTINTNAVTNDKILSLSPGKLQQGTAAEGDFLVWNNTTLTWEPGAFDPSLESQGLDDVLSVNTNGGDQEITNITDLTLTGGTVTVATEATNQAALQTLTGVSTGSEDLGSLSHPVLQDNQTILEAIVQLGDSIDSFSSSTFSTAGEIPVGDGTGLVGSGVFSTGGNLGIGTNTPVTPIQVSDQSHLFEYTTVSGGTLSILSNNFYATDPTTFERTVEGTGSFLVLSDSGSFEVQKVMGGAAGTVDIDNDIYEIISVDSAEFRISGLIDANNGFFRLESQNDHFFALDDNATGNGFNFEIQGSNGTTQGGDIILRPGGFTSTGVNGRVISDGELLLLSRSGLGGQLTLEGQSGNQVTISGPQSTGPDYELFLPDLPGNNGDLLTYTGSGVLSWSNPVFVNTNEVPRGNGTTQISSNIFSTGTDVGIGVAVPTERLDVDGSVEIPATDDYKYATAKTKNLAISPLDFRVLKASTALAEINFGASGLSARIVNGDAADVMGVPIYLPDGATITNIGIWGSNFSSTEDVQVELIAKSPSTAFTPTSLVTIPSSTTGVTLFTATPGTVIDYSAGTSYFIKVTGSGANEIGINGIRITYTVTKAD
ncbi:MAG: hypothetical protein WBA74_13505 [Cyclobacteriaceae bacterium]